MATIQDGYVYLTTGTVSGDTISGGTTVDIYVTGIEHQIDKKLGIREWYISKGNATERDPVTYIRDRKKIRHTIVIKGYIVSDATETRQDKFNNLNYIIGNGTGAGNRRAGTFTVVWGTQSSGNRYTYSVNLDKISIKDVMEEGELKDAAGNTIPGEGKYSKFEVTMNLIVGVDR